jgi:hypothetical protein
MIVATKLFILQKSQELYKLVAFNLQNSQK